MDDKYNQFFYPNVCHICKRYKDIELNDCARCHMISYCNRCNQKQHWPQHRIICKAIRCVLQDKDYMNTEELTSERWNKKKMGYMESISKKLGRELVPYEKQMFMFPKACLICHRQGRLKLCGNCPSASFCVIHKHSQICANRHKKDCDMMRFIFEIDKKYFMEENRDEKVISFKFMLHWKYFYNMESYLSYWYPDITDMSAKISAIVHSEYVTRPLTVCFAMGRLKHILNDESLVIHFIVTTSDDVETVEMWKILFYLTYVRSITVVLLGPVIKKNITKSFDDCFSELLSTDKKRRITLIYRAMLYEEYVRTRDFQKPNFIIGFNAIICSNDYFTTKQLNTLMPSSLALAEQNCPFVLALNFIDKKVEKTLRNFTLFCGRNPFLSFRICRYSNILCNHNQYLIIYEKLDVHSILVYSNFCIYLRI